MSTVTGRRRDRPWFFAHDFHAGYKEYPDGSKDLRRRSVDGSRLHLPRARSQRHRRGGCSIGAIPCGRSSAVRTRCVWRGTLPDRLLDRAGSRFRHNLVPEHQDYKKALLDGLFFARQAGTSEGQIAALSVFTTQSIAPAMEAVRDHLRALPAPVADFRLGPTGERTVFLRSAITALSHRQQTGATPPAFTTVNIGLAPLDFVPGAVGTVAYGRIEVVNFLQPDLTIRTVGTAAGVPPAAGTNQPYFNLYIPSGAKPPGGWPVAVIGAGAGSNKETFSVLLAAKLAEAGIASLGVNSVARGFGPLSTNTVTLTGGAQLTFFSGGRGSDRNGDNLIESAEGADATGLNALLASRDTATQTILEHVQLAKAIEAGVDVDGDGVADVDADRIMFIGWSFGSNYGVPVVALDPAYRTAVFSAVGGPLVDNRRLGVNRSLVAAQLAARTPSLINLSGNNFNENFPLRDQAPVVNTVPGAMAIQDYLDRNEWAQQPADIVPFAIHLRSQPLAGSSPRAVLINIAKGDQTVPNPAASRVIRAGALETTGSPFEQRVDSPAGIFTLHLETRKNRWGR